MQINFLKRVVENTAGPEAVRIVDLLYTKKDINEFLIAKKLGLTINQTRNLLYRLSHLGILSSIRKKDKRKGWYIYFWTLNTHKAFVLLKQNLEIELAQIEMQLKNRLEERYYFCHTCSIEVNEETALLNNFTCPECEGIYKLSDNKEVLIPLEKNIERLKKDIEIVSKEIKVEEEKLEKRTLKKIKRVEQEKKAERVKRRMQKEKLIRKEEKLKEREKKKTKDKKKVSKIHSECVTSFLEYRIPLAARR